MERKRLDCWLEGYLDYERDVRRLNRRSIIDKRCTLGKVAAFMARHRPGVPLWKLDLGDYLAYLNGQRERGASENVLAKQISHLRGALDYAWRSGKAHRNVLDGFSLQAGLRKVPPRALSLDEAERLVHACDKASRRARRARLMVLLLYGCGLRTSELCGLDIRDVKVEGQEVFVRHGKGDKERLVPVPGAVWLELMAYMAERGGRRGPLFRTEAKRRRVAPREVVAVVKAAAARAGLEWKVTPKTLRHSFGTHLMDRGVDIAVIASLMGHSTANETGVYLHALPGRREDAVSRLGRAKGGEQ